MTVFPSPERTGTLRSFDGQSLAFSSYGRGRKGAAIVCFNGLACDAASWGYLVDYFRARHRVATFDYRGHGDSPPPDSIDNLSVETSARDGLALMDKLGIRKAVLIGHSMGGQVILEFAHRYPERVRALILVLCTYRTPLSTLDGGGFLGKRIAEPILRLCQNRPDLVRRAVRATATSRVGFLVGRAIGMYNPALCRREDWLHYLVHFSALDHRAYGKMALSLQDHDAGPYLPEIRVPTLIVGGEKDTISPARLSEEMHGLIPGSELFMLRGGSHIGHLEHSELLNLRIEKFLREKVWGGECVAPWRPRRRGA